MARELAGIRKHVLASTNFFMGASNFVIVALPERYVVGQTINPPEVAGTHRASGAAWVLDGRCSHWLRDREEGPSLELLVLTWRGERRPRWFAVDGANPATFAEHDGRLMLDDIRVGFPRRRTMRRLRAWWTCERTRRTLEIEVVAPAGADLAALAESLTHSECH